MECAEGQILRLVSQFADMMIEEGTDRYGPVHSPMWASVLRVGDHRMPPERPPDIVGQRTGDRSYGGGNLLHDLPLLGTFYALGRMPGYSRFAEAADRYLRWFFENCPNPVTGLFPWGEHTYWHFVYEREWAEAEFGIGDHIHDHLRQAPVWFWQKAWEMAPQRVIGFANGLHWHIVDEESFEYTRHAFINRQARHRPGGRSCDFPRHGGFYLLDWVFAYVKSGQRHFLEWAERMDRYHQDHMDPRFQALLIETRTNHPAFECFTGSQQLSLALSLLEAAALLEAAPEVAERFRRHAHQYIDGYLRMPHRPGEGLFAGSTDKKDNSLRETPQPWGSRYGDWPLAYIGLICTGLHRQTGRADILEIAAAMAATVQRTPFPEQGCVPALDLGLAMGLAVDLFDLTGETRYRGQALQHAETAIQRYWVNGIFRGATDHGAYDSQMGVAYLVHALARLGTMERAGACPIPPDYTAR